MNFSKAPASSRNGQPQLVPPPLPAAQDKWFVYETSGKHLGPLTSETLAQGIAAGHFPREAYVSVDGAGGWRPVLDVMSVCDALRTLERPTTPSVTTRAVPSFLPSSLPPPRAPAISASFSIPPPPPMPQRIMTPPPPPVAPVAFAPAMAPTTPPLSQLTTVVLPPGAVSLSPPPPSVAPVTTVAPVALAPATQPALLTDVKAEAKTEVKAEAKPEAKKELLDPKYQVLPYVIFAGCAAIALLMAITTLALRPSAPHGHGQATTTSK